MDKTGMIRKAGSIVLAITLVTACIACSAGGMGTGRPEQRKETQETGKTGEKDAPKTTLKLYYLNYNKYMDNAVLAYQAKYPGVKFDNTVFDSSRYEEFTKKLTTEIMVGEGPDILVCTNVFRSIHKAASSGVFADLDLLISQDPEEQKINLSDYFPQIMDSGVLNGKRYILPLRYSMELLYSTPSILKENGVSIDAARWSVHDLGKMVSSFRQARNGYDAFFSMGMGFGALLRNSGLELVDYAAGTTRFQSGEFIQLLNLYKEIYPVISTPEVFEAEPTDTGLLGNKRVVLMCGIDLLSPENLWMTDSRFQHRMGESPEIYPFPTYAGSGAVYAEVQEFAAINVKCRDKQAALRFLKILLSKDHQKSRTGRGNNFWYGAPVNIRAFEEELDDLVQNGDAEGTTISDNAGSFRGRKLPDELAKKVKQLAAASKPMPLMDKEVFLIIAGELDYFLDGRRSAEQTARVIDEKATLYLNE